MRRRSCTSARGAAACRTIRSRRAERRRRPRRASRSPRGRASAFLATGLATLTLGARGPRLRRVLAALCTPGELVAGLEPALALARRLARRGRRRLLELVDHAANAPATTRLG